MPYAQHDIVIAQAGLVLEQYLNTPAIIEDVASRVYGIRFPDGRFEVIDQANCVLSSYTKLEVHPHRWETNTVVYTTAS